MNPEQIHDAAKRLFHDPLFKVLVEHLREGALLEWASSPADAVTTREQCYQRWQAIVQVEEQVKAWAKGPVV